MNTSVTLLDRRTPISPYSVQSAEGLVVRVCRKFQICLTLAFIGHDEKTEGTKIQSNQLCKTLARAWLYYIKQNRKEKDLAPLEVITEQLHLNTKTTVASSPTNQR